MGEHRNDADHPAGHMRATVRALITRHNAPTVPMRPVAGADETDLEKTIPTTMPLRRPPDDWIGPDAWAQQHSGKAVQR